MKKKAFLTRQILCAVIAAGICSVPIVSYAAADDYPNDSRKSIIWGDGVDHGTIEGGIIEAPYPEYKVTDSILLTGTGTKLATNNADIYDHVMVAGGAELTVNKGSINAGPDYVFDASISGGQMVQNSATVLEALGAKITVNDAYINSSIYTTGDDGNIILNNTDINTVSIYDDGHIIADTSGKILLNGNKDTIYTAGKFVGTLNDYDGKNSGVIEINGGTLKADNLRALTDGSLLKPDREWTEDDIKWFKERISKNIVLQNDGVIETKTGEIFEHGIDTSSDETVLNSKDSGKVTNDYIKYNGGTINFNDIKYSQAYLDSAKNNMADVGTTNINMLGTLVTETGEPVTDYTVEDAVQNGNVHTNAVVKADSNIMRLVVGNGTTDENTQYSNGSFLASQLALGANTYGIDINNGKELGLGGKDGGALITGGTEELYVSVNKDSTLTLGRTGATSADTNNTLDADVMVMGGTLNAAAGKNTINGYLTVVPNGSVNVAGGAELNVADGLETAPDTKLNVAGTLTADDTSLMGAELYVGSDGQDANKANEASQAALKFRDDKVDAKIIAGENSVVSLGTNDVNDALNAFAKTDLLWGTGDNNTASAVYINTPQDVSEGIIAAGKNIDADSLNNGTVYFGSNSILMINGKNAADTPVLNGVSRLDAVPDSAEGKDDGAKLYIDNAENGKTYMIADKGIYNFWTDDNIVADNALLKFEKDSTGLGVTASYQSIINAFGGDVVIGSLVDKTLLDSSYHGTKAADFFNAAVNDHYNLTREDKIVALNSAANMGELGGVNHGIYSMSGIMTDAAMNHLSIAYHGEQDNDIWARYIHSREDVSGMKLGGIEADYDAQFNGIIVGGDFYKKGKATVGAAFAYADADIDGGNRASRTKNDADYYGLSLYGRIDNGDSALLGDITYLHGSNDITQYNSLSEITASPDTDAFSMGLRLERAFAAGKNGKLVPYIGARYLKIGAGNYTNSLGMTYDVEEQDMWQFPVGISYSSEFKHNDWIIQPLAEIGYVFTTGDRETEQTVLLNGTSSSFGFETADSSSFVGRLGISAKSEAIDYGLSYEYQNGDTTKANRFLANVTFKF